MYRVLVVLAVLAVGPVHAQTMDRQITWTEDATATSYRAELSSDMGATWIDLGSSTTLPLTVTVPATGVQLIRSCNVRSEGESCRFDAGVWFNGDWGLRPLNIGTP